MKVHVILGIVVGVLAYAHSLPTSFEEREEKLWPIPQRDGGIRWMTHTEAVIDAMLTEPHAITSPLKMDKVRFFLYTRINPTDPIEVDMDDIESLVRSTFNSKHPTRFMVHGWNSNYLGGENRRIREALLLNGNYNFFAVDWTVYGESYTYITSQQRCSKAGKIVAEFIDWLNVNASMQFDTLAVYGHSLGAHVAGFAGKNVQRGRVQTIVGLDPAMPLFEYDKPNSRLADNDAEYVETIQTNGGNLGFYNPIGYAAFYPNGGKSQPGCGMDLNGGCAHSRSVIYFAEALKSNDQNNFYTVKCSAFENIKEKSCSLDAEGVRLGDPVNAEKASGIYYLETNSDDPFAIGNFWEM